jgi:hypothetical protein
MSHAHPTPHERGGLAEVGARSFVPDQPVVAKPERPSYERLLTAFAHAVARAVQADPTSHESWRRPR